MVIINGRCLTDFDQIERVLKSIKSVSIALDKDQNAIIIQAKDNLRLLGGGCIINSKAQNQ